jgi:hypothetical protein
LQVRARRPGVYRGAIWDRVIAQARQKASALGVGVLDEQDRLLVAVDAYEEDERDHFLHGAGQMACSP